MELQATVKHGNFFVIVFQRHTLTVAHLIAKDTKPLSEQSI